jgi:amino acid permease
MLLVAIGFLSLCKRSTSAFAAHPNTRSVRFIDSELHAQFFQEEAAFPRSRASDDPETTKASIPNLTTSLVKSIVGGGVLALPAAVSALGDNPTTVLPVAVALIAAMGVMNAFYFSLIGKVCSWTDAATYTEAWERSVGAETSPVIAGVITLKTAFACLTYSMILADTFSSLADVSRTDALLAVTITALAPLCMMKDLRSLAPYSLAGIVGMGCTALTMVLRSQDGSYEVAGRYLEDLPMPMQPCFGETGPCLQGVVLACTLATAFVSHYNAPRFHAELDNTAGDNSEFDTVTYTSYAVSAAAMAIITVAGFATFGAASQPVILNNYSVSDPLMTVCRSLTAASMVATFPLPFVGLRDGVMDVMQVPATDRTGIQSTFLSIGLLAAITATAASVQDLSLVLSVGGGTISTAVASVFPTIMFQAAVAKYDVDNQYQLDAKLAGCLMWISVAVGATGVTLALQHAFSTG